jgi:AraC-like DNA-binding protein
LERLLQARDILAEEFQEPPSLIQLAHRVGMNDFKLKKGFRKAFGTTAYEYVRGVRMDKARALLESGDLSVGETAVTVGYTCFGHFSAAFKKRFGILPRDVKFRA